MEFEMIKLTHEMELLTAVQDNSAQRDIIELQSLRETDQWHRQLMAVDLARLTDDNALLQRRIEQL
jgi:hypothetical protein